MREVMITDKAEVAAEPAAVWAAIKDPSAHASWHPFLTQIQGAHDRRRRPHLLGQTRRQDIAHARALRRRGA